MMRISALFLFTLLFTYQTSYATLYLEPTSLKTQPGEYSITNLPKVVDKQKHKAKKEEPIKKKKTVPNDFSLSFWSKKNSPEDNKEFIEDSKIIEEPFSHRNAIKQEQKSWINDMTQLQKYINDPVKSKDKSPINILDHILKFKTKITW